MRPVSTAELPQASIGYWYLFVLGVSTANMYPVCAKVASLAPGSGPIPFVINTQQLGGSRAR